MKTSCILILIQLFEASAELVFMQLTKSQTLELTCCPQKDHGSLMGLHLYHRSARSQTTLLSMADSGELRVNREHRGRLQLCGGLETLQVNVTLTHLQPCDTGLYMWELSYRENSSDKLLISPLKVLLFVEGTGTCQCLHNYPPLLWTISAAAGLLLLTFSWLAVDKCVKAKHQNTPRTPAPIYQEITRKQQSDGNSQNNCEAPAHLEEVTFPVYANPNIRQPQENYYACPRKLALAARI